MWSSSTNGTATIQGQVQHRVVLSGDAVLQGATLETIFVVDGTVAIGAATTVTGDVRTLNATVTQDPAAVVSGSVRAVDADLVAFAAVIVPAILLFMLGFALVTIVAGLALAALGVAAGPQRRGARSATNRPRPSSSVWPGWSSCRSSRSWRW